MLADSRVGGWETRYSARGYPYQVWRSAMPWIEPEVLESAVYLYPSEAAADDGLRMGGSGFLISVPVSKEGKSSLICVVTNKHVVDGGSMIARLNTVDDQKDIIPLDCAKWFFHSDGDDLAICPISLSSLHKVRTVPIHSFLTKKIIEDYEVGPGDDVFVVGRFVNHEGKQRNLPSVRFGNISQMPWEPIVISGHSQESFLVEARSISGYSGSPVFVYLPPAPVPNLAFTKEAKEMIKDGRIQLPGVSKKRANIPVQLGPWLMGVDYCHIRWDEPIWSKATQEPLNDDWFIKSNTGMMGVVPAWKIMDVLEGPEMSPIIDQLKTMTAEAEKSDTPVELDAADLSRQEPPTTADNPQHKEDFNSLVGAAARKKPQADQT